MFLANPYRWFIRRLNRSGPANSLKSAKIAFTLVLLTFAFTGTKGLYAQDELSTQARIVGGNLAGNDEWPSLVALVMPGIEPLRLRQFCGGSVVADRWVLTAAHCMFNQDGSPTTTDQIRIVAGINDLNDAAAVETVVTNIFVHPQYENLFLPVNDIALLELGTSVPVPQNFLIDSDPELLAGTMAFIAGWGATTEEGPVTTERFPSLLQDATLPIVSRAQCNLPESYNGNIPTTQLCAGFREGGVDSCQGDSGGPLYILEGTRQVQIGVTSFGAGCARPNLYGVYTNVNAFRPWMSNYFNLSAGAVTESAPVAIAAPRTSVTVGGGNFAGSTHPLFLTTLAGFTIFLLIRTSMSGSVRRFSHCIRHGRRGTRVCSRKLFLLAAALLSASACSSNLPLPKDIDDTNATPSENNATVIESNKASASNTAKLSLSGADSKVGFNQLILGSTRSDVILGLSNSGFKSPDCDADKTSIKGTGRLFLREQCQALPIDKVSLEGLDVDALSFQILDNRLIKLEVSLQSGDAMALTSQLDLRYEHVPSSERPFEWRLGNDHIRIVTSDTSAADGISGMSLQMIDGRLKDKLPKLFEYP